MRALHRSDADADAAEGQGEEVSYLCVGVPAHRPRVSHLPVLDKLGAGA